MTNVLPAALMSNLVAESLDAVTIVNAGGEICYMNAAMQALSGYAPGEAIGQPLTGLLPDGVAARHQHYIDHYVAGNRPSTVLGKVREFAIRHRSGIMIPIELKAVDLGQQEGVRYFGAFMVDLRPRRQMESDKASLLSQLEKQALTDVLTGVANRRAFEIEAAHVLARAQRGGGTVTAGIADIDNFKRVNDQYGHPVGDVVLREIARIICKGARAADMVARIGGEEFGLLLPDATPAKALTLAERIREAVAATPIVVNDKLQLSLTISIGLASIDNGLEDALSRADTALYRAKEGGRNRVEVST